MSETSIVSFYLNSELKAGMESVCKEIGISMDSAFIMFAMKVCRERRIPFEVNADPFYSAGNMAYLARVTAEIDSGAAPLAEHSLIES